MPGLRIGFRALRGRPPEFRTERMIVELKALQAATAQRVVAKLREYPPEIPTSSYVRTGDLGAAWEVRGAEVSFDGISTSIENNVVDRVRARPYARYVQGRYQAPVHQGRWLKADEAIAEERFRYAALVGVIVRRNIRL